MPSLGLARFAAILLAIVTVVLSSSGAWAQSTKKRYVPKSAPPLRASTVLDIANDSHFHSVVSNDLVRVLQLDLTAGESTPLYPHHYDYIVVSLGPSQFEAVGDTSRFPFQLGDGEMQVVTGGWPHKLVNTGTAAARLLLIEVIKGIAPTSAACGLAGRSCSQIKFGTGDEGSYSQTLLFDTATVRLLRGELGPGGALPENTTRNDFLIVSLTPSRITDELDHVFDQQQGGAIWKSRGLGLIKNLGQQDARMLILELK